MNWYYSINGQRQGPVAQTEFERLVSTSVITDQTLVWKEGMADWKPYAAVKPAPVLTGSVAGSGSLTDDTAVCVVSGKIFPKREMIQYEGKWVGAQYRDEFFQRMRQGMAPVGEGVVPGPYGYGGFWRRFCAKFVDGIILFVATAPINMAFSAMFLGTANFMSPQLEQDPEQAGAMLAALLLYQLCSILAGIAAGLAYSLFFIRKYQATPGKMALGLKLVRSDGSNLSKGRIVGRHFAEWVSNLILCIGYLIAAFDNEKKSLHDIMCDTRVIKTRQ